MKEEAKIKYILEYIFGGSTKRIFFDDKERAEATIKDWCRRISIGELRRDQFTVVKIKTILNIPYVKEEEDYDYLLRL